MTTSAIDAQSLIDEFEKSPWMTKRNLEELLDNEYEQDNTEGHPELTVYRQLFTWDETYELVCSADAIVNRRVEGSMILDTREEMRSHLEHGEFSSEDLQFDIIDHDIYYEDIELSEYYIRVNNLQLRDG